ncbi:MAG TPA: Clp protease N-terminal domain-containing protein, partial [Dongiaceae bacterium]|nr:Clp protease N-terminal domain-containing protein [Dongiaceae bacterium]
FMATVKLASLLLALVPVWALLTAGGIIRVGILPSMVIWLFYAAVAISLFPGALGGDPGQEGGSGAPLPPSNPRPQTIPPNWPVPPELESPLPPSRALAANARQSLELAREEARRLGHDFIGTEHVLLGILESATGSLAAVLQNRGLDREALRREIERLVAPLPPRANPTALPFTPRARRAPRLAGSEAKRLKRPVIGAEHLLLGLLREGSGVAAQALKNLGFRLQPLRAEISE